MDTVNCQHDLPRGSVKFSIDTLSRQPYRILCSCHRRHSGMRVSWNFGQPCERANGLRDPRCRNVSQDPEIPRFTGLAKDTWALCGLPLALEPQARGQASPRRVNTPNHTPPGFRLSFLHRFFHHRQDGRGSLTFRPRGRLPASCLDGRAAHSSEWSDCKRHCRNTKHWSVSSASERASSTVEPGTTCAIASVSWRWVSWPFESRGWTFCQS
jgi:hypothetical protein